NACTASTSLTITQPVALSGTPAVVNATCGASDGSASITAAGGTGAYTYSWNPGGSTSNSIAGVTAGTYNCTITDANGCSVVVPANVGNAGGPTVTPGALTPVTCFGACNGSAVVNATGGTGALTYSWSPSGGTAATAAALCPGSYTCTVSDANGCQQSLVLIMTQPAAVTVSIPASVNVLCNGGNGGSASASASGGTGAIAYAWTPAGGNSANASGLTAGLYTVTVTDANGCTNKDTITIHQPAVLTVQTAGVQASCHNKCDGQLICIPSGGTQPYTYAWNTGCNAPSCNAICAGIDTIKITDAHGCTVKDTASVQEPVALSITMTSSPAYCNQSNGSACATVTGSIAPYTYSWTPAVPGSLTSCYNAIVPGTYTVLVKDSHHCPDSATVVVSNIPGVGITIPSSTQPTCFQGVNGTATAAATAGTQPYTYSWTPAGGNNAMATGLAAGTYTCSVKDSAGCTAGTTITLLQPAPVVVTPMGAVTMCIGQCMALTASGAGGAPGYTYTWTLNGTGVTSPVCPVITSIYTVIATDANGCASLPATVQIMVNPPLEIVTAAGKSICPGASDTLQAVATGGSGVYAYSWIPAFGLSSTTVSNPVANPATTLTYTVIVRDNCNTPTDSALLTVTVYPAPVVVFTASDTAGCAPLCITFSALSNPACAAATWNLGDGTTASTCTGIAHCYTLPGLYSISENITDIHGCKGNYSVTNYIDVWPLPEAAFTLSPQPTTILEPQISFTDQSTPAGTITGWAWTFGDFANGSSTKSNPQYTYPDTGCFTAQLIVSNNFGCKDTAFNPVCIHPDFAFYVPNAFTPNGDGKNDVWSPEGVGVDPLTYHMSMFDRWGNLIWETRTWGQGWDGRANGGNDIAQIDTYVWKCQVSDFLGNPHKYTGHCNIIK
ncbi:MAG TPA: PKD domain-containing protein, partial [Bacteroidia bacterium]|nr:PKD domain-containing protein [Bacteroidia bacterium]